MGERSVSELPTRLPPAHHPPSSPRGFDRPRMELTSSLSVLSWLLLLIIGLLTICLLKSLLPKRSIDIRGKYVLITGCDSGFGRATAIRLDEMGVRVLATCLTSDGEKSLKSATSDRLKTFQMDVTNSQQIKEVFEEVKKEVACGRSLGLKQKNNNKLFICSLAAPAL